MAHPALPLVCLMLVIPGLAGIEPVHPSCRHIEAGDQVTAGTGADTGLNTGAGALAAAALRCAFIENRGQLGRDDVLFYSMGALSACFGKSRVEYRLISPHPEDSGDGLQGAAAEPACSVGPPGCFSLDFPSSNQVLPRGIAPLPCSFNYFLGDDPSRWRSCVGAFEALSYDGLYDGIDLVFRLTGEGIKYQFTVHPGASPEAIRMRYEGAEVAVFDGEVRLSTAAGEIGDGGLSVFQDPPSGGRSQVEASMAVHNGIVHFELGEYDRGLPLVIDPLVYSRLVGGSAADYAAAAALDNYGNAFVAGGTLSADFPVTKGAYNETSRIGTPPEYDLFVLRMRSDGASIFWCTFIGSSGHDYAHAIWADRSGNTYVAGNTLDFDFPATPGAFDTTYNGHGDAFVLKLRPGGGALLYSTFLGGEDIEHGYAMAVDEEGRAHLTGSTASMDFPVTAGAFETSIHAGTGLEDAFALRLAANGSAVDYCTYLGGGGVDMGLCIALDASGGAHVAGGTDSEDFPISENAYGGHIAGLDAFVANVAPDGGSLASSTLIGGTYEEMAYGMALDAEGNIFLTGSTTSANYPVTTELNDHPSNQEVFVSKLGANASWLLYSARIGGSRDDHGAAVCVDPSGCAHVAGTTGSEDFPVTAAAHVKGFRGGQDAFLFKINPAGGIILYSTFLGGGRNDSAAALALDQGGRACLAGTTASTDFTGTKEVPEGTDAFVLMLAPVCVPSEPLLWARPGNREVTLQWRAPEEGGASVKYYDIYRGTSEEDLSKLMAVNGGLRTADDTEVANGRFYTYAIVAANASGDGERSNPVTVMPGLPPSEPWGLEAVPGPGWVRLSWNPPNETYDVPVLSYSIIQSYGSTSQSFRADGDATNFTVTGLWHGRTYAYEVSAVTVVGGGPASDRAYAMPSLVPSAPRDLGAQVLGRALVLNWEEPINPGASPILYYNIYRTAEADRTRLVANASGRSYEDPRLPAGEFLYHVAAVNGVGEGYATDDLGVTIVNIPPAASFSVEPLQGQSTTQFAFTSACLDLDGKIANYTWHFGDGSLSNKGDPEHYYTRRGVYNVTLRVLDDDGGMAEAIGQAVVSNTPPRIEAASPVVGNPEVLEGQKVDFSVLPSDPDEDVLAVRWSVDGRPAGNGSRLSLSFSDEGRHEIRVTLDDGQDRADRFWSVNVVPPPPPPPVPLHYYLIGVLGPVLAAAGIFLGFRAAQKWKAKRMALEKERRDRAAARAASAKKGRAGAPAKRRHKPMGEAEARGAKRRQAVRKRPKKIL